MAKRTPASSEPSDWPEQTPLSTSLPAIGAFVIVAAGVFGWFAYSMMRIEVPARNVAVVVRRTGQDLSNDLELVPPGDEFANTKGVRIDVLREGRYFRNPWVWDWYVMPAVEVPKGKLGVLIRLFGADLPHGELLAREEGQKGIVPDPLKPGRYPEYTNPFAYQVEIRDPVTVPAGHKGVVTLVTGAEPVLPNNLMVELGERGVQPVALDAGTYYANPYVTQISIVDCRTKRLNLSADEDMGFPSKDGFWIRLDGAVQFHVSEDKAPEVYVAFNEDVNGDEIYEEIVDKIIMPTARSFCRLAGSSYTGKQFIEGGAREEFQNSFQRKLADECRPKGIEVVSALITKIYPPEPIAEPVRRREIAQQEQLQYQQQMLQQQSEAKLITQQMLIDQKKQIIEAETEVVQKTTKAMEQQQVAVTEANRDLEVAKRRLEAARDKAEAITSRGQAEADVIRYQNEALAAGLKASVKAFGSNGYLFAQQTLYEKLAPTFRRMMVNTADNPFMTVLDQFHNPPTGPTTTSSSTESADDNAAKDVNSARTTIEGGKTR